MQNEFKVSSHQRKLHMLTNSTKIIYDEVQLSIFDNTNNEKQEKLDSVIDKIKDKYGYNMIKRAGKIDLNEVPDKLNK